MSRDERVSGINVNVWGHLTRTRQTASYSFLRRARPRLRHRPGSRAELRGEPRRLSRGTTRAHRPRPMLAPPLVPTLPLHAAASRSTAGNAGTRRLWLRIREPPKRTRDGRPTLRQLGGLRVLRGVRGVATRRRRGPVALRPRLSPGVPLSIWIGLVAIAYGPVQKPSRESAADSSMPRRRRVGLGPGRGSLRLVALFKAPKPARRRTPCC
jgi:hypothetical protein